MWRYCSMKHNIIISHTTYIIAGIGASNTFNLNPITSMPFGEHQFQAGYNSTARKLVNAIFAKACGGKTFLPYASAVYCEYN